MSKFSDNVKKICQEREIARHKLAQETGISEGTIRNWERGNLPSIDKALKIADYLNVNIYDLLEITPPNKQPEDEAELLHYFRKLPEKERYKWIGRLEDAAAKFEPEPDEEAQQEKHA